MSKEKIFSEYLFWDIDSKSLDYEKHSKFIIERIVQKGKLSDFKALKDLYGLKLIREVSLNAKYLDKITHNFLSIYFDIPKEDFRCYKERPLNQKHWNY